MAVKRVSLDRYIRNFQIILTFYYSWMCNRKGNFQETFGSYSIRGEFEVCLIIHLCNYICSLYRSVWAAGVVDTEDREISNRLKSVISLNSFNNRNPFIPEILGTLLTEASTSG